ncbi:MAG: DUF433 domain-containing protein [Thermoguttaceae bacterium]
MSLTIDAEPAPLQTDTDGVVRVGGTRVTLDTIVVAFQQGATAEEIAEQYPSVALSDVYAAIAFYLRHRSDVEAYLQEGNRQGDALRRELEAKYDRQEIRNRLLVGRSSEL